MQIIFRAALFVVWMLSCLVAKVGAENGIASEAGTDLRQVLSRTQQGYPLRYVAFGGSITQGGQGWIGPWLKKTFPQSEVTVINSGLSSTGSDLGLFRIERDVIAHQPDLVAIEFCVNDAALSDEEAIRCMESLVVRLKQLPHPPAIVIVEAAAKNGANRWRHQKVAQHYGLFEVDFQQAVIRYLKERGGKWEDLFSDQVHPNLLGNEFYAQVMGEALGGLLMKDSQPNPTGETRKPLPAPLSSKPLILDGRLVPLSTLTQVEGWQAELPPSAWWGRCFQGILGAEKPGSVLNLSLRGTWLGLFYPMDKSQGSFFVSVDGEMPQQVFTNFRGGFSYDIIAKDVAAVEHQVIVSLPPAGAESVNGVAALGPVRLGYGLVAGDGGGGSITEAAPRGCFSKRLLASLRFEVISAGRWSWIAGTQSEPGFDRVSPAEMRAVESVEWHPVADGKESWLDCLQFPGMTVQQSFYARTLVEGKADERVLLALAAEQRAKLWVNGQLVAQLDKSRGKARLPVLYQAKLRHGTNQLLVKVVSAGKSLGFSVALARLDSEENLLLQERR